MERVQAHTLYSYYPSSVYYAHTECTHANLNHRSSKRQKGVKRSEIRPLHGCMQRMCIQHRGEIHSYEQEDMFYTFSAFTTFFESRCAGILDLSGTLTSSDFLAGTKNVFFLKLSLLLSLFKGSLWHHRYTSLFIQFTEIFTFRGVLSLVVRPRK